MLAGGARLFPEEPHMELALAQQLALESRARGDTKDYDKVRSLTAGAVAKESLNPYVLLRAAEAMLDLEDYRAAAGYLLQVRPLHGQLEPEDDAAVLYISGRIMNSDGKLDAAESMFREAIEVDDSQAIFHVYLARTLLEAENIPEARVCLDTGLKRHPNDEGLLALHKAYEEARSRGII